MMRDTTSPRRVEVVYPVPEIPVNWNEPRVIEAVTKWAALVRERKDVQRFEQTAPQNVVTKWWLEYLKKVEAKLSLDARIDWAERCIAAAEENARRWNVVRDSVQDQLQALRKKRKCAYGR